MLIHFYSLHVGHKNTWHETQVLQKEIFEVFNISNHYEGSGDTRMSDTNAGMSDEDEKESDMSSDLSMAL